jgi:signal transduction histidine kinase
MLLEEAAEESDDAAAADLHKIHDAGQHLLKLVNLVLDLSKIEAGRLELVPEELAVAEFIESIIDHQQPKADRKAITLTLNLPEGLKTARWDGPRVRQAVGQVVENAIKFTEAGSVTVTVSRRTTRSIDDIIIEVRDTGVGIEPSILPTLFEKFIVADDASASKYGDTGLGLTLSLALCRLMGGTIAVESVVGEGSCFTFTLPTAPPARRKRKPARVVDGDRMNLAA